MRRADTRSVATGSALCKDHIAPDLVGYLATGAHSRLALLQSHQSIDNGEVHVSDQIDVDNLLFDPVPWCIIVMQQTMFEVVLRHTPTAREAILRRRIQPDAVLERHRDARVVDLHDRHVDEHVGVEHVFVDPETPEIAVEVAALRNIHLYEVFPRPVEVCQA